ncbi:MAG TPA: copper-containing nitrite reductase [Deinococcales bacterium]|nr:copper-containing nitrite reductase [Deinococcales bacterium]
MRLPNNKVILAATIPAVLAATVLATFKPGLADGAAQAAGLPESTFTLELRQANGRMLYRGVGNGMDGVDNPELRVKPGQKVTVRLVNVDVMPHDFTVREFGAQSKYVMPGQEASISFTAGREGSFRYYCSLIGHRMAGMEGDLVVSEEAAAKPVAAPSISRSASDLPEPLAKRPPQRVRFDLETTEVQGRLADGSSYKFWTFGGKVPGPMLRVREGDTVEVNLSNAPDSLVAHSIDLHAVTGPGGGAVATQTAPGKSTSFSFKALHPGLYVYHCATPMVAHHIASGMYGLILVEPEGGLRPVDREFYVMQGEVYTAEPHGTKGALGFSGEKLLGEDPEYFVFNGAAGALTGAGAMQAKVGETVRVFFGVGGPNFTSSLHLIGETFDAAYPNASLGTEPDRNVQSALTATGGASIVEFRLDVPGRYVLVDHSLSRMERGLAAHLEVSGASDASIFHGEVHQVAGH